MELVSLLCGTDVFHYKHVATFAYKMSFNTFVPAEFQHRFWHSKYGTQYETLAKHVETSWNDDRKATQPLTDYLKTIRIGMTPQDGMTPQEIQWEQDAWETIWSDKSKRIQVVETLGKLKQMVPDDKYVEFIHQYIFDKYDDVLKMIKALPPDGSPPDGSLLSFLKGELKVAATNHFKLQGVYTNNGDKLSTIGDLHGDFDATIRVLQNMGIIKTNKFLHDWNVCKMASNRRSQDEKLDSGTSSQYEELDYAAYTWDYGANMLVQTGNLFDGHFNSREIIELFMHLDETSGKGQVVNMAAEREFMQYNYGMNQTIPYHWMEFNIQKDSMSFATNPDVLNNDDWQTNRYRNLGPESKYFKWIAKLPIVVYETQSKTIFSHGSIVSKWTDVCAINSHVQKYWKDVDKQLTTFSSKSSKVGRRDCSFMRETLGVSRDDDSPLNSDAGPIRNHYYSKVVSKVVPEDGDKEYLAEELESMEEELESTQKSFKDHKYLVDRLICTDFTSGTQQYPVEKTPSVWFIASVFAIDDENKWGGVELFTENGVTDVITKQGNLERES